MKLCLIAPLPPPNGGVANWERILEKRIREDKEIQLHIINIAANKRPTDGRTIWDRVFYSSYVMFRAYLQLRRSVKHNVIDVVHMTTSGGLGFYRDLLIIKYLKRQNIRSVYHIHFGRSILYKQKNGREWKQLCKVIEMADNVITIDRPTYELLKPLVKNVSYINNPIDVETYESYELKETKTIIYIGWIIQAKGIEELLQAFEQFNKKMNFAYSLNLVGPVQQSYLEYLKGIYSFSNVIISGEVEHEKAMRMLAESDVFVLPSYTEGFPNVILEAMALKKMIIATEVGAIPEMLGQGAGMLIKPKDVGGLAYALEKSVNAECKKQYEERAFLKVKNAYDIEDTYVKYKEIWKC